MSSASSKEPRQGGSNRPSYETRRRYLNWSEADDAHLRTIHELLDDAFDEVIAGFYEHLRGFSEVQPLLKDERRVARLKEMQRRYLRTLGIGLSDPAYVEARLRIGQTHERVELDLSWYLGAYQILYELMIQRLRPQVADLAELERLATSLHKAMTFDQLLVMEAYEAASSRHLRDTVRHLQGAREQLTSISRQDELTQVLNRRGLLEALEEALARSREDGEPLTVLFIDLDRFKALNDGCGHLYGDAVLAEVAARARHALRSRDILGRYGGDEFVAGLVGCDLAQGEEIAERLRAAVSARPIEARGHSQNASVTVGVSLAVDPKRPNEQALADILEDADHALYEAKRAGRNRVTVQRPAAG